MGRSLVTGGSTTLSQPPAPAGMHAAAGDAEETHARRSLSGLIGLGLSDGNFADQPSVRRADDNPCVVEASAGELLRRSLCGAMRSQVVRELFALGVLGGGGRAFEEEEVPRHERDNTAVVAGFDAWDCIPVGCPPQAAA